MGPLDGLVPPLREHLRPVFALLRIVRPICHIPFRSLVVVTRHDDVTEVMANDSAFGVPYGPKIQKLAGKNFLLGFDDGDQYRRDRALAMRAFPLSDVPLLVDFAAERSAQILQDNPGGIDAMKALVTPILVDICQDYLGVVVGDRDFPLWAMAASGYLFNPSRETPTERSQAEAGAQRLRSTVDKSIDQARNRIKAGEKPNNVIERLIETRHKDDPKLDDATLRALIITMIVSLVPTGTLAAGNMLQMLLRRADMMAAAQAAAHTNDDDLLRRCLLETLRFLPVSPVWRRDCKGSDESDFVVLAPITWYATRIRKGLGVLAATQSAMFDSRRISKPWRFDPTRPESHSLVFGYGVHRCLGVAIASTILPAILKPLLRRPSLTRAPGMAGRRRFFGIFPEGLSVTYQS